MKDINPTLAVLMFLFFSFSGKSQYYDFPFVGWQQTLTTYTWTGVHSEVGIIQLGFSNDTLLDQQTYITNGYAFFRSDQGKIFQY